MQVKAKRRPPVEPAVLWEMGLVALQQKAQELAGEIAYQVPGMLEPNAPYFSILEDRVTLADGRVVKLQVTAEVVE